MVEQRKAEPRQPAARSGLRDLSITLAVALLGCVGALGGGDPTGFLIWIAIFAPAGGFAVGALGVRPWLFAPAAPGAWMVTLALLDSASERDLPTPLWSALAWTGLFVLGLGLGRAGSSSTRGPGAESEARGRAFGGAGVLLLVAGALVALPGKGGAVAQAWPPSVASALLELSPATLVVESAGVDWMRHRAIYEPVGTDRFQRLPYRGELAGPLALVVGCLVAFGAGFLTRSAERTEE